MLRTYDVEILDKVSVDKYYKTLGKIGFIRSSRDLKISKILDECLDLDFNDETIIEKEIFCTWDKNDDIINLTDVAFLTKSIKVNINHELIVQSIKVDISVLSTYYGNVLKNLIEDNEFNQLDIKVHQHFNKYGDFLSFYI